MPIPPRPPEAALGRRAGGARELWLLAAALLLLTGAVAAGATFRTDATALSWSIRLDDGGAWHGVARILVMGGQFWLAGSVLALLAAFRGWVQRSLRPVVVAGMSMAGLEVVVWALKALTGRTAPASGVNAVLVGGSSYPSGHAAAATFAMLLGVVLLRGIGSGRPGPRWPWVVGLGSAVTVGVCTVVLEYHWPSDAVGGWLLGALAAGVAACRLAPVVVIRPEPAEDG